MPPSQRDPVDLPAACWRLDGHEEAKRTAPPEKLDGAGLTEGLRYLDAAHDPLLGSGPDNPCHGTVTSAVGSAFRLTLPGASDRIFDVDTTRFVLHGIAEDGKPVSLLDCFASGERRAGGYRSVAATGHVLVHGEHLQTLEGFAFDRARFELAGLRELFAGRIASAHGETADPLLSGELTVAMRGASITFRRFERRQASRHRLLIENDVVADVQLDASAHYAQWQEGWVRPLMNLVELATREPSRTLSFAAVVTDVDDEPMAPMLAGRVDETAWRKSQREVAFVVTQSGLRLPESRHAYKRMLFDATALGDDFPAAVRQWYDMTADMGEPLALLLSTLASRMYVTSQLVVLGSVAEAYQRHVDAGTPVPPEVHEDVLGVIADTLTDANHADHYARALRHANQPTQRERIQAIIQRAGEVVAPLATRPGRLAQRLVDTRNALVHLPADPGDPLTGVQLVEAVELLVLSLQANLLLDIGIAPARAAQLVENSYGQQMLWQRLQVRATAWSRTPAGEGRRTTGTKGRR